MEYLNLNTIKEHLNIDKEYTAEDSYLESLGDVVEQMVENHIGRDLQTLDTDEGLLPAPIRHAMLLLLGNFYNNREAVQSGIQYQLPLAYEYLLQLYKNYDYEIKENLEDEDE